MDNLDLSGKLFSKLFESSAFFSDVKTLTFSVGVHLSVCMVEVSCLRIVKTEHFTLNNGDKFNVRDLTSLTTNQSCKGLQMKCDNYPGAAVLQLPAGFLRAALLTACLRTLLFTCHFYLYFPFLLPS